MRQAITGRFRQRGVSLVELLVVMVISMILVAGIYRMFTGQLKIFSSEDETATLQQQARMAEELLLYTIQQTGGGAPEGSNSIDLQGLPVLAATDRYLVVQYDDPNYTDSLRVVRANEIVVFAVSNETGTKTEDIEFTAYFDKNEDGKIDRATEGTDVTIPLTLRGPPYNLYRMTLTNDGGVTKSLVAQNVDNLIFRYFDNDGAQIPYNTADKMPLDMPYALATKPVSPAKGLPDIRFIEMDLVLRTKNSDPAYTAEYKADATTKAAFSVATYNSEGVPAEAKTFNDGHRRRAYATKMVPRNLPAMPCGKITLSSNPATCPDAATVTASAQDRYGDALSGKTIKFTFPGGTRPGIGPFFGASATTHTTTLSASGGASVSVNYKGTTNTIIVAAEIQNVDCSPGGPSNFTLSDSVGVKFNTGPAGWVTVSTPTNNRKSMPTEEAPLLTGTDTGSMIITTFDECGNKVLPNPANPPYQLGLNAKADGTGSALGTFASGTPASVTNSPLTLSIVPPKLFAMDAFQNAEGEIKSHVVEASPRPAWVKKVYLDELPGPWSTGTVEVIGPEITSFLSAPWPPTKIELVGLDLINGQEFRECPLTPPVTNLFKATDNGGFPLYKLTAPRNSDLAAATLTAALTEGLGTPAVVPADSQGVITGIQTLGTSPNLTYTGPIANTDVFSLTWQPPSCSLPDVFTDLLPAMPEIDLTLTSPGVTVTTWSPKIKPCDKDCEINATTPTPCEPVSVVTLGTCNLYDSTQEGVTLEVTGGTDAFWQVSAVDKSVANPGHPTILNLRDIPGPPFIPTYYLAIGDSPLGSTLTITAKSVRKDALGTNPAWQCSTTVTVANKCDELRVKTSFVDDRGIESDKSDLKPGALCAAGANRLYVEIDHCRNTTTLSPNQVEVKILQNGVPFDTEMITLTAQPNPDGTLLPARLFTNNAGLNMVEKDSASSNGILEYPSDGSLSLVIVPWQSAFDAEDSCPDAQISVAFVQPIPMCFPNAITSGSGASWSGNFKIHWGDIVVRGSMDTPAKFIEKYKTAQYDGDSWTGNNYTDRLADIYVGHTSTGAEPSDGSIVGVPTVGLPGVINQPFKNSEDAGNYFTNISFDKITSMIVNLNYDKMKELAKSRNAYWFALNDTTIKNTATGLVADVQTVLDNPPNAYYNGDFIFIDTYGTLVSGDWIEPQMPSGAGTVNADGPYVQGLADASISNLPSFSITGNYYTEGIIYVAGTMTLGGGGSGKTIPAAQAPPNEDTRYDYISATDPVITDENDIPIGAKPTAPVSTFDLTSMQMSGALYCLGQFGASGGPKIYGSISAERGYTNVGTPEVWYNYRLNQSGYLGSSLCVKCCNIKLNPSTKRLGKGTSVDIVATGNAGTITWDIDDPSIATYVVSGDTATVTGQNVGTTKLWAVDSNNCAVQTTITVINDCTGYLLDPASIVDLKIGETQTLALEKAGEIFVGGNFTWTKDSNAVILTPPASPTGTQLATVTGADCGTATITATDNSIPELCTNSPFTAMVSVISELAITGTSNTPPSNTVYVNLSGANASTTAVTATTTAGGAISPAPTITYPYLGDANRAKVDFSASGTYVIKAADNTAPGCGVQSTTVSVGCAALSPTVAINSPVNNAVYFTAAATPVGQTSGTDVLEFMATPSGGGAPGIKEVDLFYRNDTTGVLSPTTVETVSEYCGFGGDDCSASSATADVSTWTIGSYTFSAFTKTYADTCGVEYTSPTVTSLVTIKACDTLYSDTFTSLSATYWTNPPLEISASQVGTGGNVPTVAANANQMLFILKNKNNNTATASAWVPLKATGTTTLSTNQGFVASIDLAAFTVSVARTSERTGLRIKDAAGNWVMVLGTGGTISSAPIVRNQGGTLFTSGSSTVITSFRVEYLPASSQLRIFINNGASPLYTASTTGWSGSITIGPYSEEPVTGGAVKTITARYDNFVLNCLNPIPAP